MNMWHEPWLESWRSSGLRRLLCARSALLFALAPLVLALLAHADDFSKVYYDASRDELVVAMIYSGTNPDHAFSLQWGQCKKTKGDAANEIEVEVLDSQWQDPARHDFSKTIRFSLADLRCRPAKVTLRTAPRFVYTLLIPARAVGQP